MTHIEEKDRKVLLFFLSTLLLVSCSQDLFDPEHAYYVESGHKAEDRRRWMANIAVCGFLVQPLIDDLIQNCIQEKGPARANVCSSGYQPYGIVWSQLVLLCADRMTKLSPGAHPHEMFDSSDI